MTHADVLLTRAFGYPGRINEHERVWITIDMVAGVASITLNGQPLGVARDSPFEADVTPILGPRNQLDILLSGGEVGEVAMEVRATAYLQAVRVRRSEGKLEVDGMVAGTCDRSLELYVTVDGRHVLYRTIEAGESFTAPLEDDGQTVRVELVHVATVWSVVQAASC